MAQKKSAPQKAAIKKKKRYDGKYVSLEHHEIMYIQKLFLNEAMETLPSAWIYFTCILISGNRKKVLRDTLYSIIESMGYRKDPQLAEL